MEVILAAIAAASYFCAYYRLAFWIIAVAILYALLILARLIANRSWYSQQRTKARLAAGKGFAVLLVTKVALLDLFSLIAIRLAELSGYYSVAAHLTPLCYETHALSKLVQCGQNPLATRADCASVSGPRQHALNFFEESGLGYLNRGHIRPHPRKRLA